MDARRSLLSLLSALAALAPAACEPPPTLSEGEGEGEGSEGEGEGEPVDIPVALERAGVFSVTEIVAENAGTRAFELYFQQPLDHDDPDGVTFLQRAVLIHKDFEHAFVLNPTGYELFAGYEQLPEELTSILDANQLQVEHRFFANSHPEPWLPEQWSYLTVEQAAADHHRIVEILRPLYIGKWLETGHSKGGMTSVFHAVLYPDDIDVVVPYVAPVSFAIDDTRGAAARAVLGDPACRNDIRAFQTNAAEQRADLLALLQAENSGVGDARIESLVFQTIGAIEWGFWQYTADCTQAGFYTPSDDPAETQRSLGLTTAIIGSGADAIAALPYYYQVQNQLGSPDVLSDHLDPLLGDIQTAIWDLFTDLPFEIPAYDDGALMHTIQDQVLLSDRFLFVYGGYDPWTTAAFEVGVDTDSARYVAPGLNHSALLIDLADDDKAAAFAALGRWLDVDVAAAPAVPAAQVDRWRRHLDDERAWLATRVGLRPGL